MRGSVQRTVQPATGRCSGARISPGSIRKSGAADEAPQPAGAAAEEQRMTATHGRALQGPPALMADRSLASLRREVVWVEGLTVDSGGALDVWDYRRTKDGQRWRDGSVREGQRGLFVHQPEHGRWIAAFGRSAVVVSDDEELVREFVRNRENGASSAIAGAAQELGVTWDLQPVAAMMHESEAGVFEGVRSVGVFVTP